MATKKVTYTLPIEAIKQVDNIAKRTGKSKSGIIADLIMNTETNYDKIINMSVNLETCENVSLEEMMGAIKTGKKFDPLKMKNKSYLRAD